MQGVVPSLQNIAWEAVCKHIMFVVGGQFHVLPGSQVTERKEQVLPLLILISGVLV